LAYHNANHEEGLGRLWTFHRGCFFQFEAERQARHHREDHSGWRAPNHQEHAEEMDEASDELYDNMRGPIKNVHLLATAYSKGTKAHEPMIWTVDYGKGRVFHTPMGHEADSMRCVGFSTTLQRGTEWAATAKVTLKIPENFPTEEKTSSLAK